MIPRRLGSAPLDQEASFTSDTSSTIHVSASRFQRNSGNYERHHTLALVVVFTVVAAIVLVILVLLLLYRKGERSNNVDVRQGGPGAVLKLLKRFSYSELKAATDTFSDACRLGQGGFGTVYKGVLEDGREIAIKRLDTSSLQGESEFQNEISLLGRLSSPYIVGLVGYCAEGQRKLLVYDLMDNGSLQEALFGKHSAVTLDWDARFKIMVDVACALVFLHSECDPPVIHGDIKPSNILLDVDFTARLADFGLARFKSEEDSTVVSGRLSLTRENNFEKSSNADVRDGRGKKRNLKENEALALERNLKREEQEEILECNNELSISSAELCCEEEQKGNAETISQEIKTISVMQAEAMVDGSKASPSIEEDETALHGWGKIGCQFEEFRSEAGNLSGIEHQLTECKRKRVTVLHGLGERMLSCVACQSSKERNGCRDVGAVAAEKEDSSVARNHKASVKEKQEKRQVKAGSLEWWKECDGDTNSREFNKRLRKQQKSQMRKKREPSLNGSREIKKAADCSSRWWNEDSRNLSFKSMSAESFTFDFSGDLNHSMELAGNGRGLATTTSREWWSGDLPKGREWWSGEFSSCKRDRNAQAYSWSNELMEDPSLGKKHAKHGSRSTDGWSGDILSRGMSSTPSMRGTVCYVAPEYTGGGILTEKSDVYSYGVLLLVIISGRRPLQVISSPLHELERANLISWARQAAMAGTLLDLVDASLQNDYCKDQAYLCVTLALLCLQKIPSSRPTMQDVLRCLTGEAELPSLPTELFASPTRGGISPLKPGKKVL